MKVKPQAVSRDPLPNGRDNQALSPSATREATRENSRSFFFW